MSSCDLVMERLAGATVSTADAVLPVPALADVTVTVLVYVPDTALVTFALTVQELLAGIVPPVRLIVPDPETAVNVPPLQEPVTPLGVATTTFAGSVSVKATPFTATGLMDGLVMVKLTTETPVRAIRAGLKVLVMEGGTRTTMLADAEPPVTPTPSSWLAVMLLVTLFLSPEVTPVTFTE